MPTFFRKAYHSHKTSNESISVSSDGRCSPDYIEQLAHSEPIILRKVLDDKVHLVDVLLKTHIEAWLTKYLDKTDNPTVTGATPSKGQRHNERSIHSLRARKSQLLSVIERVETVRKEADEAGNDLPSEQDPLLNRQSEATREEYPACKNPFRDSAQGSGPERG